MWNYHTLQYATKATGAYLSVHGSTCGIPPNACTVKIKDLASYFQSQAIGIPPASVNVTFVSASGTTVNCNPVNSCSANNTLLACQYARGEPG